MSVVSTNMLNRFWEKGIKPIKEALSNKLNKPAATEELKGGYIYQEVAGDVVYKEYGIGEVVDSTLVAGQTTLIVSDSRIKETSMIDIYADVYGVSPKTAVVTNGSITMTFKAQANNLNVRVVVNNGLV